MEFVLFLEGPFEIEISSNVGFLLLGILVNSILMEPLEGILARQAMVDLFATIKGTSSGSRGSLGTKTNNVVEMQALLSGIHLTLAPDLNNLIIKGDSQILITAIGKLL